MNVGREAHFYLVALAGYGFVKMHPSRCPKWNAVRPSSRPGKAGGSRSSILGGGDTGDSAHHHQPIQVRRPTQQGWPFCFLLDSRSEQRPCRSISAQKSRLRDCFPVPVSPRGAGGFGTGGQRRGWRDGLENRRPVRAGPAGEGPLGRLRKRSVPARTGCVAHRPCGRRCRRCCACNSAYR